MTDKLPPNLLALFQPRPPLRYIPPQDTAPDEKALKQSQLSGIAAYLPQLEEYKATDVYEATESWLQQRDRKRLEKKLRQQEIEQPDFQGYRPNDDPKIKGDAVKTLFVGRLSYDVKEADLEREFGRFGPIERIRIVKDETTPKPKKPHRGYAFIVYEREKDMRGTFFYANPSARDPSLQAKDPVTAYGLRTEESLSMLNVAVWSQVGDREDSAEVLVDEDIPSKLLQSLHSDPRVGMAADSEGALAVVVEASAVGFVATEEALVGEVVLATRAEEASADDKATRMDLLLPTRPADPVGEVVMAEAMTIDGMGMVEEGINAARLAAIPTPSEDEIVDMTTETETVTEIETEKETAIETETVIDTEAADVKTTTARENDTTKVTGTMIPDNAEGIEPPRPVLRIVCNLSITLWLVAGGYPNARHPQTNSGVSVSLMMSFCIYTAMAVSTYHHRITPNIPFTSLNMLYAGYYNLTQAEKNSSAMTPRRVSEESTSSKSSKTSQKIKSSIKNALDQLRPTTETLTPAGIYSPVIKQGALFGRKHSTAKVIVETPKAEPLRS
ncbi:hypothetical protein AYO22_00715 [Fonsecaea multimorphosa]|nr:hypothetical protein AYO22_00715 [Fonsecaea multimorphosa]